MQTLGERIKFHRELCNLTQEDVAKELDTTPQNIYKYEKNIIHNIPPEKICAMAKIFGITPAQLYGWDDVPDPYEEAMERQRREKGVDVATLTETEKTVVKAYREKPETHVAVHRILGIEIEADEYIPPRGLITSFEHKVAAPPLKPYDVKKKED